MLRKHIIILLFYYLISCVQCLHLKGNFNTGDFFMFLAKFGFQKTDNHDHINTLGFIYGNISSQQAVKHKATFVVVDRQYFLDYYRKRKDQFSSNKDNICQNMFEKIDTVAYDRNCKVNGTEDFLRNVPCLVGELCEDEDTPERVVNGHQFTYAVQDNNQARYYACVVLIHNFHTFFFIVSLFIVSPSMPPPPPSYYTLKCL